MTVELYERRSILRKDFTSTANFEIFPILLACRVRNLVQHSSRFSLIKEERAAKVAERETNTSAAGERTANFHHWHQGDQFISAGEAKVDRLVPVSFAEHFRPGGAVEKIAIGMGQGKAIPI